MMPLRVVFLRGPSSARRSEKAKPPKRHGVHQQTAFERPFVGSCKHEIIGSDSNVVSWCSGGFTGLCCWVKQDPPSLGYFAYSISRDSLLDTPLSKYRPAYALPYLAHVRSSSYVHGRTMLSTRANYDEFSLLWDTLQPPIEGAKSLFGLQHFHLMRYISFSVSSHDDEWLSFHVTNAPQQRICACSIISLFHYLFNSFSRDG